MNIFVDIDGTICSQTDADYHKATPLADNISKINKLHQQGNTITYWTARGSTTGIDWLETTKSQLEILHPLTIPLIIDFNLSNLILFIEI